MTPEEIDTIIKELRSLEHTIKKAKRMHETRTQKLVDEFTALRKRGGFSLRKSAEISQISFYTIVNVTSAGRRSFTPDHWKTLFDRLHRKLLKKPLAMSEEEA